MAPTTPGFSATDPPDDFLTVAEAVETEIKVKKSRFIALIHPAEDQDQARQLLHEAARRFHDARHICYGYKLGTGTESYLKKSDDGEPSGTGGEPILAAIKKRKLTDTLVMVVRYFGGIKLGTGGLARAYGQAADEGLDKSKVRTVLLGRRFRMVYPYAQEKTIGRLVVRHRGRIEDQVYEMEITCRIWLPHSTWRAFAADLTETTAGSVGLDEEAGGGN